MEDHAKIFDVAESCIVSFVIVKVLECLGGYVERLSSILEPGSGRGRVVVVKLYWLVVAACAVLRRVVEFGGGFQTNRYCERRRGRPCV